MSKASRSPRLQLDVDMAFQRRQWAIQRAGWAVMTLIVLLGLLGAFGNGALSHAVEESGTLRVEYERFVRAAAPSELKLRVTHPAEVVHLQIDRPYLDAMPYQHIYPEPQSVQGDARHLVLTFDASPPDALEISIDVKPRRIGTVHATIRDVDAGTPLSWRQLVYP